MLIVRSSSWDVVELCQRVLNFDESGLWIGQSALEKVVCVAALQQIIFNSVLSPILERTIRAHCRSPQAPLTCFFDKYVLQWVGEDAFDVQCRTSPVGHNVIVLAARIAERSR